MLGQETYTKPLKLFLNNITAFSPVNSKPFCSYRELVEPQQEEFSVRLLTRMRTGSPALYPSRMSGDQESAAQNKLSDSESTQ